MLIFGSLRTIMKEKATSKKYFLMIEREILAQIELRIFRNTLCIAGFSK